MQPGVHRRAWCAVNDHCSDQGPVWRCKNCILMEPVMQVPSRGTNLQGTFHSAATPGPARQLDVQVELRGVNWLQFKGGRLTAAVSSTASMSDSFTWCTLVSLLCCKPQSHASLQFGCCSKILLWQDCVAKCCCVDLLCNAGNFGSSAAPHAQGFWYFTAEHPASRTWFQRVLWHCSPPTQSLLD